MLALPLMLEKSLVFLGPNGAGKTTTIRMMVGLSTLTSGDLFISGYSIQSSYSEAIKHVGVIIENPEMYNHLTARKNMIHFARMNGAIDYDRINELIELVGLTNVIDKKSENILFRNETTLRYCASTHTSP